MQCPFCKEEIKDGARKCRFCGEFLENQEKTAEKIDEKKSETKKKALWKNRRFRVPILFLWLIIYSVSTSEPTETHLTTQTQKSDPVQERINHFIEVWSEVPEFEKVERFDGNAIWIYFTSTPDLWIEDSIDQTTRWQARNLSLDVNGVASVKTFVWWIAQMFCTATKGQVNDCFDYR